MTFSDNESNLLEVSSITQTLFIKVARLSCEQLVELVSREGRSYLAKVRA